jgi:hypothetical protein
MCIYVNLVTLRKEDMLGLRVTPQGSLRLLCSRRCILNFGGIYGASFSGVTLRSAACL